MIPMKRREELARSAKRPRGRLLPASLIALALCCFVAPASAQRFLPDERPGDQPQLLPPFEEPEALEPVPILPPYPLLEEKDRGQLSGVRPVEVREIEIEGNTVVASEVLRDIAKPYEGRALTFADLENLRDQLTLAYVKRGFATSGASLPDQTLHDGVLRVQIVEGRLGEIDVDVRGRFRPSYFRSRLAHANSGVLNVDTLQQQLQLFLQNPQITSLEANLEPSSTRGISQLKLVVEEAPFYDLAADFDNYRSPVIGSLGGTARTQLNNLIGVGDAVYARFTGSEGLRQAEVRFEAPFTVWDTQIGARSQYSFGRVVDSNFEALGLESEALSFAIELAQPLYRTPRTQIAAEFSAGWRRAQSFLFDGSIGLPTEYSDDGKSQVTVLRFGFDAYHRTRSQSLAFRTLFSWGIDALGATVNSGKIPDGRFVAWLGQFQWASRLPWFGIQTLLRADAQLSPDPLLPLEQFAIGGRYTVRGYRENLLVRDNGFAASFEVRVPVFERFDPAIRIELAPFADVGRSWNNSRASLIDPGGAEWIGSVGIGARVLLTRFGFAEIYWGHRLKKIRTLADSDAQDDGIHFRVSVYWP